MSTPDLALALVSDRRLADGLLIGIAVAGLGGRSTGAAEAGTLIFSTSTARAI